MPNTDVPLDAGSFTLTGYSGNEFFYLQPATGSFTLTGYTATVEEGLAIPLDAGSFTFSGFSGVTSYYIPPATGSFTLAGQTLAIGTATDFVLPATGSFALTGHDAAVSASDVVSLDAGSFTLAGLNVEASVPAGQLVAAATGAFVITGYSGNEFFYMQPATGTFALTGHNGSVGLAGSLDVALARGAFNLSGNTLVIGSGLGDLTGTINVTTEPATADYTLPEPFNGTVHWVITTSATPPGLRGTPAGFVSGGEAFGNFPITTSGGTATADLSAVPLGDYYVHTVAQRTSDGAFTGIDSDAISLPATLVTGTFTLSGFNIALGDLVEPAVGVFTLTGYSAEIGNSNVSLDAGSFGLTGHDMLAGVAAPLGVGSFSVSGFNAIAARLQRLNRGIFTLTGYEPTVIAGADVALNTGAFTYSGHEIAANINAVLGAGSFSLSGYSTTIIDGIGPVGLASGSFGLTGFGITATYLQVTEPNHSTPENSARGGIITATKRGGFITTSERGGVASQSDRGGIVKRGT